jgi:hypothetical protein
LSLDGQLQFSEKEATMPVKSIWSRYGFAWVTLAFFIIALAGQWLFGWYAYVDEQQAHQQPIEVSAYAVQLLRDTLENWQSEFLQLIWQVAGSAFLFHVGSPQSKEGNERLGAKLDEVLRKVDPKHAPETIHKLDQQFER